MEALMKLAEHMSEHVVLEFAEKWIGPIITRHWIVSLILMALVLFPAAIGWYRRRRTL